MHPSTRREPCVFLVLGSEVGMEVRIAVDGLRLPHLHRGVEDALVALDEG
jgi:hypothetical protein